MHIRHRPTSAVVLAASLSLGALVTWPATATAGDADPAPRIAFSRYDPRIDGFALWSARPDGSHGRRLTRGQAYFPDWSPDRARIVFDFPDEDGDEQIATVRADGTGFRQLTDLPGVSECADYSPDGRHVVFDRYDPAQDEFFTSLWVMRSDGSRARPLFGPDSTTFDVEPEYSPDGTRIVFGRIDPATEQEALFVTDADGTDVRQLTPYAEGVEHPRWSPDGRWIVYDVEQGLDPALTVNGIYLVRPDGRDRHRLFQDDRLVAFKPDFSPDGRHILFGCYVRALQQEDLCVMRADGSGWHRVVRTRGTNENWPVWD